MFQAGLDRTHGTITTGNRVAQQVHDRSCCTSSEVWPGPISQGIRSGYRLDWVAMVYELNEIFGSLEKLWS